MEILDETKSNVLSQHSFGITSLVNKRDLLQKGDLVTFKIDEIGRAADVNAVRQKKRATVDSIKGQFGFLNYEIEEGKKLFFHMSEVQGNAVTLHPADTVEFSVVTNQVSCSYKYKNVRTFERSDLKKVSQSPDLKYDTSKRPGVVFKIRHTLKICSRMRLLEYL